MAYSKKFATKKLQSFSDTLNDHVLKVVIFKDVFPENEHKWIHEIKTNLNTALTTQTKSRINKDFFENSIFYSFGQTSNDSNLNLVGFKIDNENGKFKGEFPDFEITNELKGKLASVYNEIRDLFYSKLKSKSEISDNDLEKIFNRKDY